MSKAWLTFVDVDATRSLKRAPKGAGIVNLTVQGVFKSGQTYGHMNGYPYEIVASKVSDVVVVQKGMKPRVEEEKAEKRWACGGSNPR